LDSCGWSNDCARSIGGRNALQIIPEGLVQFTAIQLTQSGMDLSVVYVGTLAAPNLNAIVELIAIETASVLSGANDDLKSAWCLACGSWQRLSELQMSKPKIHSARTFGSDSLAFVLICSSTRIPASTSLTTSTFTSYTPSGNLQNTYQTVHLAPSCLE
jgi:hypothetical protein